MTFLVRTALANSDSFSDQFCWFSSIL